MIDSPESPSLVDHHLRCRRRNRVPPHSTHCSFEPPCWNPPSGPLQEWIARCLLALTILNNTRYLTSALHHPCGTGHARTSCHYLRQDGLQLGRLPLPHLHLQSSPRTKERVVYHEVYHQPQCRHHQIDFDRSCLSTDIVASLLVLFGPGEPCVSLGAGRLSSMVYLLRGWVICCRICCNCTLKMEPHPPSFVQFDIRVTCWHGLCPGALLCCRLRHSTRKILITCYSSKQHDLHWPLAILFVCLKVLLIVCSMASVFPSFHSLLSKSPLADWATCLVSGNSPGPPPFSY
jgi:hypothetical protein